MKKFIALMVAFCVWAVNSQFVFADVRTTFDSYDEVLDYLSFGEYALCDINNDGSKELIAGEGGTSGYLLCSYYNGKVQVIDYIGCNSTMYIYNNALYDICLSLEDVTSTYVSHEIWMTKYTLSNGELQGEVLYDNIHKISIDNLDEDTYSTIPEIASIMNNGTRIIFYDIDDRSLLKGDASVQVILNGERLYFEKSPQILSGRTLVPLRAIFEAMGASVAWDNNSQTVTSVKGSTVIKMTIGSSIMYKNGSAITLDVPPQLIDGYTMVPARAVAEAFGASVSWDGDSKTVYINN